MQAQISYGFPLQLYSDTSYINWPRGSISNNQAFPSTLSGKDQMKWELRVSKLISRWICGKKIKLWVTCFLLVPLFSFEIQELHHSHTRNRFNKGCQWKQQTFVVIYYWDPTTLGLVASTGSHTVLENNTGFGMPFVVNKSRHLFPSSPT